MYINQILCQGHLYKLCNNQQCISTTYCVKVICINYVTASNVDQRNIVAGSFVQTIYHRAMYINHILCQGHLYKLCNNQQCISTTYCVKVIFINYVTASNVDQPHIVSRSFV